VKAFQTPYPQNVTSDKGYTSLDINLSHHYSIKCSALNITVAFMFVQNIKMLAIKKGFMAFFQNVG
jgi:hypothetical protein